MGEERTHEVAGTVFCGTRLPAEPPGNPKPHRQPRFALPSAVVGVGFAEARATVRPRRPPRTEDSCLPASWRLLDAGSFHLRGGGQRTA